MRDKNRPDLPPSFALHVSQAQGEVRGNYGGGDFRALRGYTLKEAITDMYGVNPIRVLLPRSLDTSKRYDFSVVLPAREQWETMKTYMQRGLLDYFNLSATRENRDADVYVVTAGQQRKPPPLADDEAEHLQFSFSSSVAFETPLGADDLLGGMNPPSIRALRSISLKGTANQLCNILESMLDRPVVNKTNLQGKFDFAMPSAEGSGNDFLKRLRDHLGLNIAPAKRTVEILIFDFR